jgi:hypothetical protein
VQHPFLVGDRVLEHREVGQRHRVDQPGARAVAPELDQVGALAVAVARRALGVDGDRPGAGAKRLGVLDELGGGLDDRGEPVAWGQQRGRLDGGVLDGGVLDGGDLDGGDLGVGVLPGNAVLRLGRGLDAQLPSTFSPVVSGRASSGVRARTGQRELRLSEVEPRWR